jgi:CBS domain-containing protein
MTIQSLARTAVITAGPDTPVAAAAATMGEKQVGCVVVVDDGETVLGILTDRDVAVNVVGAARDPADLVVADVMTADPFTLPTDAGVFQSIHAMRDASVRRAPVVEDGRLVGIVTLDDLLVLLAGEFGDLAAIVQAESPPYSEVQP